MGNGNNTNDKTVEENIKDLIFEIQALKTERDALRVETIEKPKSQIHLLEYFNMYGAKLEHERKISACNPANLADELGIVELYINNINALPENVKFVSGLNRNLDDCFILDMFKDWILPNSVRYSLSDLRCTDLLVRPEAKDWRFTDHKGNVIDVTYNRILVAFMEINRLLKRSSSENLVCVGSLVRDVTFADILGIASIDDQVKYENNPFIPVPVSKECKVFFEDAYFNASKNLVINDWFINLTF